MFGCMNVCMLLLRHIHVYSCMFMSIHVYVRRGVFAFLKAHLFACICVHLHILFQKPRAHSSGEIIWVNLHECLFTEVLSCVFVNFARRSLGVSNDLPTASRHATASCPDASEVPWRSLKTSIANIIGIVRGSKTCQLVCCSKHIETCPHVPNSPRVHKIRAAVGWFDGSLFPLQVVGGFQDFLAGAWKGSQGHLGLP